MIRQLQPTWDKNNWRLNGVNGQEAKISRSFGWSCSRKTSSKGWPHKLSSGHKLLTVGQHFLDSWRKNGQNSSEFLSWHRRVVTIIIDVWWLLVLWSIGTSTVTYHFHHCAATIQVSIRLEEHLCERVHGPNLKPAEFRAYLTSGVQKGSKRSF